MNIENITSIIAGSNVQRVSSGLLSNATSLVSADFSECFFPEVPASCFMECDMLSSVAGIHDVSAIGDCAFMACGNLSAIQFGPDLRVIGTSAFANCGSLSSFSRFNDGDGSHVFDMVGDRAFAGMPIKTANLALRSSSIYTFWGDECFADCPNLEQVDILSACYMSNGMFKNCSNLKRVNFRNDHTSYMYPYVFENCTSLESITLPSKIWYISEGMFKGCSNLRTVEFNQYGDGSVMNFVQKYAFNGCRNLNTIKFPKSLNNISQLEDACLSNCANNTRPHLYFYGFPKNSLVSVHTPDIGTLRYGQVIQLKSTEVQKFKDYANVLIEQKIDFFIIFNQVWYDYFEWKYNDCGEVYAPRDKHYANATTIEDVRNAVKNKKVVAFWVEEGLNSGGERNIDWDSFDGCVIDRNLTAEELNQLRDDFQARRAQYLDNKNGNNDIFSYIMIALDGRSAALNWLKKINGGNNEYLCFARIRVANKLNFTYKKNIENASKINFGSDALSRQRGKVVFSSVVWNDTILKTGMFRLNRDCNVTVQSLPGYYPAWSQTAKYEYSELSGEQQAYSPVNKPESNKTVFSDFDTGQWYYNAKQIVKWADDHDTPCLVIYSLLGCKPCQIYEKNIWSNSGFQTWAHKQNFYLCGMEVQKQPYYDEQLRYCRDELVPNAENYTKIGDTSEHPANAFGEKFSESVTSDGSINSNLYPSVLAFRYNGQTWLYTYHSIDRWINEVGVNGVIQCLKSLCLKHFDNNRIDGARFVVDAVKPFVLTDYKQMNESNPYQISPMGNNGLPMLPVVADLNKWDLLNVYGTTTDGVINAMKYVLGSVASESSSYPDYIGGCLYWNVDWLSLSISDQRIGMLEDFENSSDVNRLLGADMLRLKIGNNFYILQVDGRYSKKAATPCSGDTKEMLFKYELKASVAPQTSEYREDN